MADQKPDERKFWLDDKDTVKKILWALGAACLLSVIADLFYHKHVHYAAEDWIPGMYGWAALIGSVVLVLCANLLRKLLMRPENYYDEADND